MWKAAKFETDPLNMAVLTDIGLRARCHEEPSQAIADIRLLHKRLLMSSF